MEGPKCPICRREMKRPLYSSKFVCAVHHSPNQKPVGQILREGSQKAGISDVKIDWDNLPAHRKERWEQIADGLQEEGYVVISLDHLRVLRSLAAGDEPVGPLENWELAIDFVHSVLGEPGSDETSIKESDYVLHFEEGDVDTSQWNRKSTATLEKLVQHFRYGIFSFMAHGDRKGMIESAARHTQKMDQPYQDKLAAHWDRQRATLRQIEDNRL